MVLAIFEFFWIQIFEYNAGGTLSKDIIQQVPCVSDDPS